MATITLTINDAAVPGEQVAVSTTTARPTVGQPLTPAEALTLDVLTLCQHNGHRVTFATQGACMVNVEARP
jgi:hypothetical protein